MTARRRLPVLAAALAAACVVVSIARAEDAGASLDAQVTAAERNPAALPAARKAVDAAIAADAKAPAPRLLSARLSLAEATAAKTDKKSRYDAALAALAVASQADPRDPVAYELRIKVLTAMSGPSSDLQEALRAYAIRRPGDAVARDAYKRQTGKVPPIKPGDPMPAVTWKDAKGKDVPAASLVGDKIAVLELYRSATWCPYCAKRLGELHDAYDKIKAEGAEVYAASPDTIERLAEIEKDGFKAPPGGWKKPFKVHVLSDPKGDVADALGVLNPETVTPGTAAERFGLPFPTTIVIDAAGTVRFVDTHTDFKDRTKIDEILAAVKRARLDPTGK